MLREEELQRYARQIMIRGIGVEGQEKLKKARVVIVGSGGLGSPIAIYLAAAGVGTIRIIDQDTVDLSNLNRQVLHWQKDIGRRKVDSAAEKLGQLNHDVVIDPIAETIDASNIGRLAAGFDLIVDATDNLETRFLLNAAAFQQNVPFIHGAVRGFEGRVTTIVPGQTACLRCIYRGPLPQEKTPVIGVTPAVVGCLQATEAIKYIVGVGQLLTNQLLVYDGLKMRFTTLMIRRDPNCPQCGQAGEVKT